MNLEYKGVKLKPYQVDDCIYALISTRHVYGFYQSSHDVLDAWLDCNDDAADIVAIPFSPVSDEERDYLAKALEYQGVNNDYFKYSPEGIKSIDNYVIKPKSTIKDIIQTILMICWFVSVVGGSICLIYNL